MNTWQALLQKLLTFKQVFGHWDVPYPWKQDPILSQWVVNIREARHHLPKDLLHALETAAFDFTTPDTSWQQYYQQLTQFFLQNGHLQVPKEQPEYDKLYHWIQQQRSSRSLLSQAQLQLLEQLNFCWEKPTGKEKQWEEMYSCLLAFHQQYGHVRVPSRFPQNPALGKWVLYQRRMEATLPRHRKDKLNAVGFLWKKDKEELAKQAWLEHYQQLCEFSRQHGHCRLSITHPDKKLYNWVAKQRKMKDQLPADRLEQLNALNFTWTEDLQMEVEERWERQFAQLLVFKERFSHMNVPRNWEENQSLSEWVTYVRRYKERLSQTYILRLDAVGFLWAADKEQQQWQQWLTMYEQLKVFYQQNGHTRVPTSFPQNQSLRHWVMTQRASHKEGKLATKKKQLLDEVPFEWSQDLNQYHQQHWDRMYERLQQFYQQHGHSRVSTETGNEKALGRWVSLMRSREYELSEEQKQKLAQVDFYWQQDIKQELEERWEAKYTQLRAYYEQKGHCRLNKDELGSALFDWAVMQRMRYDATPPHRIEKLKQIGFTWPEDNSRAREDVWQARFRELVAFKEQYSHCRVPYQWKENIALANWVARIRQKWDKLPMEKKERLLALGFERQIRS